MAENDEVRADGAGGAIGRLLRSSALLRAILLSLGGESVQSAFHFALGILLIRALVPHDYGLYSVIFNFGGIALTYGNALMTVPSTVYFAHAKSPGAARFVESAFGSVALVVSALMGIVVAAVLAAFEAPVETIPPASLFVAAWTLRNHLRLMAFASGHPFVATVSDAIFSFTGLVSVAALMVATQGSPQLPILLWLLAAANIVACTAAVVQRSAPLRISLRKSVRARYLKTWRDIAWSLFGVTTWNIQGQALTFLVAATHGVTAFAPIAAGIVVFRPFNTMVTAGVNVLRPRLASDMVRNRHHEARRTLLASLAIALATSAVYCAALWITWPILDRHLFCGRFAAGTMETVMPLVAITMTIAVSYHVPLSVVQAGRGFRTFALATTLGGLVGVASISTILAVADPKWSLIGVMLGESVCFAILWAAALRLLMRDGQVPIEPKAVVLPLVTALGSAEAPSVSGHSGNAQAPLPPASALAPAPAVIVAGKSLVAVLVNPARDCVWVNLIAAHLANRPEVGRVVLVASTPVPLPGPVAMLLGFERSVLRARPAVSTVRFEMAAAVPANCDIAIDLSGAGPRPVPGAVRTLCPLYDGIADDAHLYVRLIDNDMPKVEILDVGTGRVVARGVPGTECKSTVTGAAAGILDRVATLIEVALEHPFDLGPPADPPAGSQGRGRIAAAMARRLAYAATGRIYRLCYHAPHWRLGWRHNPGEGVLERGNLGGVPWRVLADPGHRFFADPFPLTVAGRSYIFFEDYDHHTAKGIISYVEVGENGPVGPIRPALEEPWHLSYPFLIEDGGHIYMIPESCTAKHVAIYRAERFPDRWVREGMLLTDVDLSDATITRHGGRLWMLGAAHDGIGSRTDLLSIYSSDSLLGAWRPHALNPVLVDHRAARPGGNFVHRDGRLWRVAQECSGGYGSALAIAEVTRMDDSGFEQRLHSIIRPDAAWPGRRVHTLNRCGTLECIDGSAHARKSLAMRFGRTASATAAAEPPGDGAPARKDVVDLPDFLR